MSSFIEGLISAELLLLGVPTAEAPVSGALPEAEVSFDVAEYRSAAG
ncbi:hypothetical protein [Bordetella avium]|nr:hypothetical protein [Bordetella avium]WQE34160.1 hypothetical protein U0029_02990 [Bordetella avium]SUV67744.1 Uncharacterised protein [Bordetella avium]